MPTNGIKAIFFDFDGTLRHSIPSGGETFVEHLRSLGVEFSEADRLRAMRWELSYWANSADLLEDLKLDDDKNGKFWVKYSQRRLLALGLPARQSNELAPRISRYMGEAYNPESVIPADVRRALNALQQHGYLMAVISNRDKPFQEELQSYGIGDYFHFTLAGGEVDSYKPDPAIFTHALKRADIAPHQTIYVGDNYFADVIGARRAGLQPVLYDPDRLFPEADCAVITTFDDLLPAVQRME